VQLVWSAPVQIDSGATLTAIACPTHALCVAVDDAGRVLTSTDPGVSGPSWRAATIDPGRALSGVSCPGESLCVAVDREGDVLSSAAPAGGEGASWSAPRPIDGSGSRAVSLSGVSCPGESLCVAVDRAGNVHTSTAPKLDQPYSRATIDSGHALAAVSCASPQLCAAVDGSGDALLSGEPAGGEAAWHRRAIDPVPALTGVSCTAGGACVAVDGAGGVLASADPTASAPTWSATPVDASALAGLSCAAPRACVAVDEQGRALAAEDPTASPPAWTVSQPDAGLALLGVACAPDGLCAAIDAGGRAMTATVPAPAVSEPPPVSVSLVTPHPRIWGVPAVGSRLVCEAGVGPVEGVSLSYAWWRDGTPIEGAANSSYRVAKADATHHLQCLVTATNTAGSASGHSAYVTIPAQGVLPAAEETAVGLARARGKRVFVTVRCSRRAPAGCAIALRLSVARTVHGHRTAVTVGESVARLRRGQRRVLSVSLDRRGGALLAHAKRLAVQLTVSGTVIGVLKATLARQRLTLPSGTPHPSHSRHTGAQH
jgi:hypothetical protein